MRSHQFMARLIESIDAAEHRALITEQTLRLSGPVRVIAPPIARDFTEEEIERFLGRSRD